MEKKLQRDESRKMLAGVAAGLGEYFDIDVTWVRVIFILMAVFGLSGVLIYIILWIVVPPKPFFADYTKYQADYRVNEELRPDFTTERPFVAPPVKKEGKGRFIAGIILVAVGAYFLLDQFYYIPYWFSLHKLWPVILIIIGLVILGKSGTKNTFVPPAPKDASADNLKQEENKDKPGDQPLA